MNYKKYFGMGIEAKLLLVVVLILVSLTVDVAISYDQTKINASVNITQAGPEIIEIKINNGNNVVLTDGTITPTVCNVTVRDYNGNQDIRNLNVTFFDNTTSNRFAPEDNNTLYYNTTPSCTNTTLDAVTLRFTCSMDLLYYTNNGTWTCYADVNDSTGYRYNLSNNTIIEPLYAINISNVIDYGDMAVNDVSLTSEIVNITNTGNQQINISVWGWGGNDTSLSRGNGYAFLCDHGNISVGYERYNVADLAWAAMTPLSSSATDVAGFTVVSQTNDSAPIPPYNQTFWRLFVPPNPFGQCNGTVVFEAELANN